MNPMKKAIKLVDWAKKSLGLSLVLLFSMFASVPAQTVDKDNARIDTLVTKICRNVPGLRGIATATPADLQTLSDYASIGLKYTVYSTEFQKIQTACQSLGINILPVDRLLPQDEKKMVSKIAFIIANDVITTILEGVGISGVNFDKATISQIKAAIAKAQDEKNDKEGSASRESGSKKLLFDIVASKIESFIDDGINKIALLETKEELAQNQATIEEKKANITNIDAGQKTTKADIAKLTLIGDSLDNVLEKAKTEAKTAGEIAKSFKEESPKK